MFGETVGTILVSNTSTGGYLISTTNVTTGVTTNFPTRIFHITLISGTGTNSFLQIYNGATTSTSIPQIIVGGTSGANRITDVDYGMFGQSFPQGASYQTDANLIKAAIVCKADKI
jgi:hypothetical protein